MTNGTCLLALVSASNVQSTNIVKCSSQASRVEFWGRDPLGMLVKHLRAETQFGEETGNTMRATKQQVGESAEAQAVQYM